MEISGKYLDPEKYENKKDSPLSHGCVQDPYDYDLKLNLKCEEDQTLVNFALAWEYK